MLSRLFTDLCELDRLEESAENRRAADGVVPAYDSWVPRAELRPPEVLETTQKHGDAVKISKGHPLAN